jgi:hypothetical protein
MTTAKELSDQITKAMEGVTPGEWKVETDFCFGTAPRLYGPDKLICEFGNAEDPAIAQQEWEDNAAYVAATQPDNMRAILSALANADIQSTADSRIAELEQQIANGKLREAAERYMLAVKRLSEESGFNRLTYFEAPISNMPTVEMEQEASSRWIELNDSGKALSAVLQVKEVSHVR